MNELIVEYLDCCDDLKVEVDAVITWTIGMQIVHGLNDKPWAERILYNLSKEHNFSHGRVKELITLAYLTWDASDPFHNVNLRTARLSMEDTLLQAFQMMLQLV